MYLVVPHSNLNTDFETTDTTNSIVKFRIIIDLWQYRLYTRPRYNVKKASL